MNKMRKYYEITAIGQDHREFFDTQTGKTIKCLCPYLPPVERDILGGSIRPEAHVKDCPIHGWYNP